MPNYKYRSWNEKKTRTKRWQVQDKNSTWFYYKNKTKTKWGYYKKTYPKLMLNILKVMGNPTFIYTHWASSSHVAHVPPRVNYEWTKTSVRMN